MLTDPLLRYALAALAIGVAVALQFVPLFRQQVDELAARWLPFTVLRYRLFQLGAGFVLLSAGIELLRFSNPG